MGSWKAGELRCDGLVSSLLQGEGLGSFSFWVLSISLPLPQFHGWGNLAKALLRRSYLKPNSKTSIYTTFVSRGKVAESHPALHSGDAYTKTVSFPPRSRSQVHALESPIGVAGARAGSPIVTQSQAPDRYVPAAPGRDINRYRRPSLPPFLSVVLSSVSPTPFPCFSLPLPIHSRPPSSHPLHSSTTPQILPHAQGRQTLRNRERFTRTHPDPSSDPQPTPPETPPSAGPHRHAFHNPRRVLMLTDIETPAASTCPVRACIRRSSSSRKCSMQAGDVDRDSAFGWQLIGRSMMVRVARERGVVEKGEPDGAEGDESGMDADGAEVQGKLSNGMQKGEQL